MTTSHWVSLIVLAAIGGYVVGQASAWGRVAKEWDAIRREWADLRDAWRRLRS